MIWWTVKTKINCLSQTEPRRPLLQLGEDQTGGAGPEGVCSQQARHRSVPGPGHAGACVHRGCRHVPYRHQADTARPKRSQETPDGVGDHPGRLLQLRELQALGHQDPMGTEGDGTKVFFVQLFAHQPTANFCSKWNGFRPAWRTKP